MILSSFIVGFLASFSQIPTMTFMQKVVPAKLQGRIFSLLDSFVKAAVPVSYLLYGLLFDKFNLSLIFMLSGILVLLYMLFMIIYSNKVKE
ncbi:H+ Antiporter protein [Chlamydia trachomatis]|nr:H+ Antiporter protein [Chlamydia trachomatis]